MSHFLKRFSLLPQTWCQCKRSFSTSSRSGEVTSAKDYYEILGVPPDATTTEIREAFYRGAKELHPDVNPSPLAKAEFEALQEAFKVLKNPRDRDRYDSSVHSKRVQRGVDGPGDESDPESTAEGMETYWMTRRRSSSGPNKYWSEQLAKDVSRANMLRVRKRMRIDESQRGHGKLPQTLRQQMEDVGEPVKAPRVLRNLTGVEVPDAAETDRQWVKVAKSMAVFVPIFVTAVALNLDWEVLSGIKTDLLNRPYK